MSLRRSDVALVLGDLLLAIEAGDAVLAHEIAFLLRQQLVGEILEDARASLAETVGSAAVSH